MKRKLPIGISSFSELRTEGYYYVDKTPFVVKLVESGKYYFLSRPRRFGKSLFVDTLKQAFSGRRELFQGLYLYDHWDWSKTYPVIHIDFAGGVARDEKHLQRWIIFQLRRNQEDLGITCDETADYRACFEELIVKAFKTYRQKVVVLIDEYDKPILDRIEEREIARVFASVVYSFLVGSGLEVIAEDYTSRGRIDLTLRMNDRVYIMEFKVVELEGREQRAIDALRDRGYAEKYRAGAGEIYLIGIDFSKRKRNIINFAWEKWPF